MDWKKKKHVAACTRAMVSWALSFSCAAMAVSMEDQFQGFARSAHMDALSPKDGDDPFSVAYNPASSAAENIFAATLSRLDWKDPQGLDVKGSSASMVLAATFNYRIPRTPLAFFWISTVPVDRQAILDSGDSDESRFVWNHFAREISYLAGLAWSSESSEHSFGISFPVFFNARATATINLDPADADARTQVFMAPSFSYRLGYRFKQDGYDFSLVYRERQKAEAQIYFESNLPLLATSYEIEGVSDYLVAPRRLESSLSRKFSEHWELGLRLAWVQWSKISSPFIEITDSTPALVSDNPSLDGRDTLSYSLGARYTVSERQSWTMGLGYRPGIYKSRRPLYSPDEKILGFAYHRNITDLNWELHAGLRGHLLNHGSFYTWFTLGIGVHL